MLSALPGPLYITTLTTLVHPFSSQYHLGSFSFHPVFQPRPKFLITHSSNTAIMPRQAGTTNNWENMEFLRDMTLALYEVSNDAGNLTVHAKEAVVAYLASRGYSISWEALRYAPPQFLSSENPPFPSVQGICPGSICEVCELFIISYSPGKGLKWWQLSLIVLMIHSQIHLSSTCQTLKLQRRGYKSHPLSLPSSLLHHIALTAHPHLSLPSSLCNPQPQLIKHHASQARDYEVGRRSPSGYLGVPHSPCDTQRRRLGQAHGGTARQRTYIL